MKLQLTPAEYYRLRELVEEVLHAIEYDDTGVTDDLIEPALVAKEILGIFPTNKNTDDDDDTLTDS